MTKKKATTATKSKSKPKAKTAAKKKAASAAPSPPSPSRRPGGHVVRDGTTVTGRPAGPVSRVLFQPTFGSHTLSTEARARAVHAVAGSPAVRAVAELLEDLCTRAQALACAEDTHTDVPGTPRTNPAFHAGGAQYLTYAIEELQDWIDNTRPATTEGGAE